MPSVLTESSKVVCVHQGSVKLKAGQSKLTVNGSPVLVDGDLAGASISQCLTVPASAPAPVSIKCTLVASATGGVATKLKVQGKGVLLDTIQGFTNGTVANVVNQKWSVQDAAQSKLTAK
jgi:hypothetical protein